MYAYMSYLSAACLIVDGHMRERFADGRINFFPKNCDQSGSLQSRYAFKRVDWF